MNLGETYKLVDLIKNYHNYFQPLTNDEKEKFDELHKEGCGDATLAYWQFCAKKNYTEFLSQIKGKLQMYKNDEPMTKKQKDKWNKLIEMSWEDVATAYKKACAKNNYTEDYKLVCEIGQVRGVCMDDYL